MSSLEMILGEPDRLEKLAVDIHDHYVSSVANDPDRVQKAMIVCSNRKIAYDLLLKFKAHYPEWFEERKTPEGVNVSSEELKKLKEMPTINSQPLIFLRAKQWALCHTLHISLY